MSRYQQKILLAGLHLAGAAFAFAVLARHIGGTWQHSSKIRLAWYRRHWES